MYATRIDTTSDDEFKILLKLLTPEDQTKASRFIHSTDRNRLIAGRLSLRFALEKLALDPLPGAFSYSEYGRPSLGNGVDFNISHSGAIAACAISRTQRVGIDIEEVQTINHTDFIACFSASEWAHIEKFNTLQTFYAYWTMKEAAIKANGKGLSIPLMDVIIETPKRVTIQSETWSVTSLDIAPGYICHVASKSTTANIETFFFKLDCFLS